MQASIFLKELLSKAEFNNEEVISAVESLQGEIPDAVADILPKLLTEKAAKSSKEINSFFENKYNERLTKLQINKLAEAGFSDNEINEIKKLKPEERLLYIAQVERERASLANNASVDERVAEMEKRLKEAEAKVLAYQKSLIDKDKHYASVIQGIKMETDLNNALATIKIRKDGIPLEAAYKLIKDEMRTQLEIMGASLQFVNGYPKLVRADDNSLDYYDENNNLVDGNKFIISIVSKLNLLDKVPNQPNVQVGSNRQAIPQMNVADNIRTFENSSNRVLQFINKIKNNSR
jgi:nicotinamide mononucleotide adenylyltransferase